MNKNWEDVLFWFYLYVVYLVLGKIQLSAKTVFFKSISESVDLGHLGN